MFICNLVVLCFAVHRMQVRRASKNGFLLFFSPPRVGGNGEVAFNGFLPIPFFRGGRYKRGSVWMGGGYVSLGFSRPPPRRAAPALACPELRFRSSPATTSPAPMFEITPSAIVLKRVKHLRQCRKRQWWVNLQFTCHIVSFFWYPIGCRLLWGPLHTWLGRMLLVRFCCFFGSCPIPASAAQQSRASPPGGNELASPILTQPKFRAPPGGGGQWQSIDLPFGPGSGPNARQDK